MLPFTVMISAIVFVAMVNTSSAFFSPSSSVNLLYRSFSNSRWLLMTMSESTHFFSASIPSKALSIRFRISILNGKVTTPTVRMPISFATRAITGAAPVPVPPPIPAVINTIFVSSPNIALISSMLASAISRPSSGIPPVPRPGPICILLGTKFAFST